jgi:hypothetical protein
MANRGERFLWSAVILVPVLVFGGLIASQFYQAHWLADQSAQAALDQEISDRLAEIPPGQPFPDSLTELKLSYEDGSDSSYLSRFEYHSTGDSCTVRSLLWDKEVMHTFPAVE